MSETHIPSKPVIVIGAGLSGLTAANRLSQKEVPVTVLESLDRVGGRTFTEDGVDQGAGYVGSTQTAVYELIKELGIKTSEVPGDGYEYTFKMGDEVIHSKNVLADLFHFLTPKELLAAGFAILQIYGFGVFIPKDTPWTAPNGEELDAMTVRNWINLCFPIGKGFDNARKIFDFICRTPLGVEPSETSFLYFLWYMKVATGFFHLLFPAQDEILIGGTQQMSIKINEKLPAEQQAKLSNSVMHIKQDDNGVTVTTTDGKQYEGDRCIIACTPHLRTKITFDPLLPPRSHQLPQRTPMGTTIKVHVFYEKRFWIDKGYNGNVSNFDTDSVSQVYDVTEPAVDGKISPCLQGFYVGKPGRVAARETEDERQQNVLHFFKTVFGTDEALKPTKYVEYVWDSRTYIGGAPVGTCPAGTLTYFGTALRDVVGRIHFGGTETSNAWAGYMDGAIRSGQRVAEEILYIYGIDPPPAVAQLYNATNKNTENCKKLLATAIKAAEQV